MEFTIYGVLIAIGALLGMGLVTLEAKRSGEDQNKYLDMTIISLLFSVVGSRLFYVAFSWELYKGNLNEILDFRMVDMLSMEACLPAAVQRQYFANLQRCHSGGQRILQVWEFFWGR